ncbi:hypothetical protein HOLleu_11774 [Holothuria leucospilota]|uniref:Zinc finger protein 865 n=1 Tax=Holothuria leucospilota TaxID=206669 RepID=A0A9Q1H9N8_HOLLE|nr:hypothetical protein HOLleu_11774 [Holothuria leucospilota]
MSCKQILCQDKKIAASHQQISSPVLVHQKHVNMSRRKQARPIRALKNSKEEDEDGVDKEESEGGKLEEDNTRSSTDDYSNEQSIVEPRSSPESDATTSTPEVLPREAEEVLGNEVEGRMETSETESAVKCEPTDLSTVYRCENCSSTFKSVTDLFQHRSGGCLMRGGIDNATTDAESRSTSEDVSDKSHLSDDDLSDTLAMETFGETDQQFYIEHHGSPSKEGPRPYPCQFCSKTFSRLSFLNRHEQYHEDKMPFRCEECGRLFKHKRSRDRHMRLHTGDKKYSCPRCGLSFARSDHLKIHIKSRCFKAYPCSHCQQDFGNEADLIEHSQTCHESLKTESPGKEKQMDNKPVSISQSAPKMYSILTGKEVHMSDGKMDTSTSVVSSDSQDVTMTCIKISPLPRAKVKPLDHGCPFCSTKNFSSVESLNSHIQKNHKVNDSNPYTCNLCGKVYPSYYNLVEHISVIHEQDDNDDATDVDEKSSSKRGGSSKESSFYICGYCTMKFASMPSLHEHVKRVHAVGGLVSFIEDGKLVCAHCNAGFPSDVALMDHFRNVHGLQNTPHPSKLPCPQCTKTYPNTKILHEHIRRSHSQPLDRMRYPCPYCVKQNLFDSIEQLQLHVEVIHKSEQEPIFLCPYEDCKSHFNSDKDLKIHIQQQHSSHPSTSTSLQQLRESPRTQTPPRSSSSTPTNVKTKTSPASNNDFHVSEDSNSDTHISCPICQKKFSKEEEMYKHSLVHFKDETLEYACKDCGKLFKRPDELQKHLFEIHAHHLYKCSLCKEIFDCKVSIQVHFAVKHSNETKSMGCIKCGLPFPTEMELLKHVKVDHLNILNYHKCLFCNHSFSSEVDLQCHLVTHSQIYKCSVCHVPFGSKEAFQEHLKTMHQSASPPVRLEKEDQRNETTKISKKRPGENEVKIGENSMEEDVGQEGCFVCQICDDKFPLKMLLDLHHQSKHNLRARSVSTSPASTSSPKEEVIDMAKYSCVVCSKSFPSRQKVLDHVHCHASRGTSSSPEGGSAPNAAPSCVCHFCQRSVKTEADFMWHTQVHQTDISTPSNHVRCVVCLQLLPPAELSIHVQFHLPVHLSREVFLCYICGKTYVGRSEVIPKLDEFGRSYFVCVSCSHGSRDNSADKTASPSQQPLQQPKYSVRCHKCNVKFETQAELASHLPTHQNKTYQCIKCQRTFGSEAEIKLHVTSHVLAEGILHECKLCHMVLDSPAKLQCHLIEHTFPDREYTCPVCKAVFASAQDIQGHAIEHGMDARQHLCTQCNQAFFFSAELENHLLSRPHHQESKSFQCGDCNMSYSSLADLSEHMKGHQARTKRYRCSVCDESFTSSDQVQQHYFNHHSIPKETTNPQEYQCFYCDKTFPGVSNLQGHMKVHSEGKKYTCPECNKVFALERNLTVHMRSHNSEKPFQCPICEKRFARKEHRKMHMKSHSGFKSFLCPLCDKMFARKIQLREHMRSHSGQALRTSLHRCDICYETFTLSKNLRRHKKRVHKVFSVSGSASTSQQGQDGDTSKGSSLDDMDVASAEVTSSQDLQPNTE